MGYMRECLLALRISDDETTVAYSLATIVGIHINAAGTAGDPGD